MDAPHTLTANWTGDYTQPGLIIGIAIVVLLVVFWMMHVRRGNGSKRKRRRRNKPKAEIETTHAEKPDVVSSETSSQSAVESTIPENQPVVQEEEPKATPDKTTMFCNQCGAKIPRGSKFCAECGTKQP